MALVVKNLPAIRGDTSSIRGSGRSPGEGDGNPLQYAYLENSMNRGAWQATDREVGKNTTERLTLSLSKKQSLQLFIISLMLRDVSKLAFNKKAWSQHSPSVPMECKMRR